MNTEVPTRPAPKVNLTRWSATAPHGYLLNVQLDELTSRYKRNGTRTMESPMPNDVSSRFGRRLRELRLQRDLTQTDMARKFGIDRSFISDVERGRKSISLPTLEVMAIGLNLTLADLFSEV